MLGRLMSASLTKQTPSNSSCLWKQNSIKVYQIPFLMQNKYSQN